MTALRYVLRFVGMGAVMTWYFWKYLFLRLGTLRHAKGEPRRQAVAHLRGRILRQLFAQLGACFVKLGQVMSTRPDLLAPELIEELRQLQDRLPPFPGAVARQVIAEDLGQPIDAIFAELDDVPVAAASVAQVHRGRLKDGTEVAVKVLRPDVQRKVHRDATILRVLARAMAWHPRLKLSDPVGHVNEFTKGIEEQTELSGEVHNYQRFAKNFAGVTGVRFPRVYEALCGPRVMTMEFMRGTKLDALPPGDHRAVAKRLQQTMFKMCFEDGFVHADLHPGNMVLVEDSGELCLFDVGLVKELHADILLQFSDFARCLAAGTPADFREHLRRFHTYIGEVDWAGLEREITSFLGDVRARSYAKLEMGAMFNNLYAIARRYEIRPMPEVVLVMVGIVTAEGIGKQLDPEANLFTSLSAFILPLMMKRGIVPGTPGTVVPS